MTRLGLHGTIQAVPEEVPAISVVSNDTLSYLTSLATASHIAPVYEAPYSVEDGAGGAVLQIYWFPAHCIVEVDGQRFGRKFAPRPRIDRQVIRS